MLVSCHSTATSSSSSSSYANQPTASASEPGLLHRLLTGQVDEADIHDTVEIFNSAAKSSTSTTLGHSSCTGHPTPRRLAEHSSGTLASQLFDELGIKDCTGDVIDEFSVYQLMTPSIDDITASI